VGRYEPLLGFWGKAPGGKAPAAKRFPWYFRGLRERWMRKSRPFCLSYVQKVGGTVHPLQKVGVRVPRVLPISYAYVN